MQKLIEQKRVIVVLGAGGVGKTSSAIALALRGAEAGKKVALLSIDPAKRLAAAMGLELSGKLSPVVIDKSYGFKGFLDATMLDQKEVFDSMVIKHAPSRKIADRILAHPVYKAASSNLSGPLEYMALAKLQEIVENSNYDLIVLDTPPDTHALDFLARPNVLAGFMENKVMSWMIKPFQLAGKFGLNRLLNAGEKLMGGIAKITGVASLHAFADFLVLMQEVIEGFHRSGEKVVATLKDRKTGFVMVSVPLANACRSTSFIADQLSHLGYSCDGLLLNRCLAQSVVDAAAESKKPAVKDFIQNRAANQSFLAKELATDLQKRFPALVVQRMEEFQSDLGSVDGMINFSRQF
jgi:anion-transporting  ArsA/GET3 family ATPase